MAPRHPAWRLRLYGTGPEEDALRRRTAELGPTGHCATRWEKRRAKSVRRYAPDAIIDR